MKPNAVGARVQGNACGCRDIATAEVNLPAFGFHFAGSVAVDIKTAFAPAYVDQFRLPVRPSKAIERTTLIRHAAAMLLHPFRIYFF
jgi:hypothetical protein